MPLFTSGGLGLVLSVLVLVIRIWSFYITARPPSWWGLLPPPLQEPHRAHRLRPRFSALWASFGSLFQQSSFPPMHHCLVMTCLVRYWLYGKVSDLQLGGCRFESWPGLLCTKVYSAFNPSGVGKWVPVTAGKAKAGMAHSDCGWACECAGKTVKSLEITCHSWALLRWWFTILLYGPLPFYHSLTH